MQFQITEKRVAYLPYVTDAALSAAVKRLLVVADEAVSQSIIAAGRNKIDPFGVLFEMAGFDLSYESWQSAEATRQAQKTLTNEVGLFHQHILGSIAGWTNLGTGAVVDLVCEKRQIVAEVKNKHNTVKGSNKVTVYDDLERAVATKGHMHFGYTAYYVEIIPRNKMGYDKPFTPSDNKTGLARKANEHIRIIDGKSFYALATGVPDALNKLHKILPRVIEACSKKKYKFVDPNGTAALFEKAFGSAR